MASGAVNEVNTSEALAAVISANPGKMVVLMIGFTFCRPCKAFTRPYEVCSSPVATPPIRQTS
jgi:hypothetical protein